LSGSFEAVLTSGRVGTDPRLPPGRHVRERRCACEPRDGRL